MHAFAESMNPSSVILIVEDNPGDIRLLQEAFKTCSLEHTLYFARDGVEATHFLEAKKQEPSNGFPRLIVLDLNLPKKSGFEVLQFLKRDKLLKRIPVIVLSSSQNPEDIAKAYDLHANCYLTKPANLESFSAIAKALEYLWIRMAGFPSQTSSTL